MNKNLEVPICPTHKKPVIFLADGMWICPDGKHKLKFPDASPLFKLTFHGGLLLLYPFYLKENGTDRAEVLLLMKEIEHYLKDANLSKNLPGTAYLIDQVHKWARESSYQFNENTMKMVDNAGWDPDKIEIDDKRLKEIVVYTLDFIKYFGLMHALKDHRLRNVKEKVSNIKEYLESVRDCDTYFFPDKVYDSGFYEDFLNKSLKIINAIDSPRELEEIAKSLKSTLKKRKII